MFVELVLFLSRFDHHAAHVVAAVRAHDVMRHGRAALGAVGELLGLDRVVRTPFAGAGVGLTSFRNGHTGLNLGQNRERPAGRRSQRESRIVKCGWKAVNWLAGQETEHAKAFGGENRGHESGQLKGGPPELPSGTRWSETGNEKQQDCQRNQDGCRDQCKLLKRQSAGAYAQIEDRAQKPPDDKRHRRQNCEQDQKRSQSITHRNIVLVPTIFPV